MPDEPISGLRPTTPEELADTLSFALRHDGKRVFKQADGWMARIAADHLVAYLNRSGFVVMRRPGAVAPDASRMMPKQGEGE